MIHIRPMGFNDIEGVLRIEEAVCDFPWTYAIFSDCLKAGYRAFVLTDETYIDLIVGYGLLSIGAEEAHILNLCIHPYRQRQGFGTRLMQHLLNEAKIAQTHSVFLEVRQSNIDALKLYQRLGFQIVGERQDYYEHALGREDAWVLQHTLKP